MGNRPWRVDSPVTIATASGRARYLSGRVRAAGLGAVAGAGEVGGWLREFVGGVRLRRCQCPGADLITDLLTVPTAGRGKL
jgi:hypothetical protein